MRDQPNIQASVLDRLIDFEPEVTHEPVQSRLTSFAQIRNSVIRDIENLLNTRKSICPIPEENGHLSESLFTYGLRDFISHNPRSPSVRLQIRQEIERTISLFEPRLRNLVIRFDTSGENERNLRFRITALLVVTPLTEPITFDTYLDINRGEFIIPK
jgi:type VI secretion system protein ImpF